MLATGFPRVRCLVVTDRRRLCAAVGVALEMWPTVLMQQIDGALSGGAIVQLREPDLEAGVLYRFVQEVVAAVPAARTRLVVNERLDVAMAAGAAGVHLRERSIGCSSAQRLAPSGFVLGKSVHRPIRGDEALAASYLVAGTVLASVSKPGAACLGWDGFAAIVRSAGTTPVFGIGGLSVDAVGALKQAGAVGLAGIGCFVPAERGDVAAAVKKRVVEIRLAFDSHPVVS